MIIIGTQITDTKIRVDGSYVDGSNIEKISASSPPNPPENKFGKDSVLYLNTETGELFWDYIDRPLTDIELILQSQSDQDEIIMNLALGV